MCVVDPIANHPGEDGPEPGEIARVSKLHAEIAVKRFHYPYQPDGEWDGADRDERKIEHRGGEATPESRITELGLVGDEGKSCCRS